MKNNDQDKTKKRFPRWIWVILVLLVLAAGIFIFFRFQAKAAQARTLANLITQPLERQSLSVSINGTGTVLPHQSAELLWQSSGRAGMVNDKIGQLVESDEVLAFLDEDELPANILQARLDLINIRAALKDLEDSTNRKREKLQAELSTAKASLPDLEEQIRVFEARVCREWTLKNLRQEYADAQKKYANNPDAYRLAILNQARQNLDFCDPDLIAQKLDQLQAQLAAQKGNITNLEAEIKKIEHGPDPEELEKLLLQQSLLEKTLATQQITAPFAGTITAVFTQEGDLVNVGMPALQLDDLSQLYVSVPISEVDIPQVAPGQKAIMIFDAYYDQSFTGEVISVERAPRAQATGVSYMVRIALDKTELPVNPGMTAGVTIVVSEKKGVLAVPAEAVVNREGNTYVYVQRNGKLEAIEVQLGEYSDRNVEVQGETLAEGDLIVLNPPVDIFLLISSGGMDFEH
jgi:HlyD family secretion protein